jgi:hypothetical protein
MLADHFTMGVERGSWNWGINWSRPPCARPSLLLPSLLSGSRLSIRLLPRLAMAHRPPPPASESWPLFGKGLCLPARRDTEVSSSQDPAPALCSAPSTMALCECSTPPGLGTVVSARKRRAVSVVRTKDDKAASGQSAPASVFGGLCASAASRDWSRREQRRPCMQRLAPSTGGHNAGAGPVASSSIVANFLSCAAGTLPSLFCRAVGAQCTRQHCWSHHDPANRACLMPSPTSSACLPSCSTSSLRQRAILLGKAYFSERMCMPSGPHFASAALIRCSFCSVSL